MSGIKILTGFIVLLLVKFSTCDSPTILGPSQVVLPAGTPFNLTCKGSGTLRWKYPSSDTATFDEVIKDDTAVLTVFNSKDTDTGLYSCSEYDDNDYPVGQAAEVYVYLQGDKLIAGANKLTAVQGFIGESVVIPCRPTSPDTTITLSKGGVKVDKPFDPRVGFHIEKLTLLDNGPWTCKATLGEKQEVAVFMVYGHSEVDAPKPEIDKSHAYGRQVGNSFSIDCLVPKEVGVYVELKWISPHGRQDNQRVYAGKTESDDDYWIMPLHINNATKDDEGVYICRSKVGKNIEEDSVELKIFLPSETYLELNVVSPFITVTADHRVAHWSGQIDAFPPGKLTWRDQRGRDLLQQPSKYEIHTSGSSFQLEIKNVQVNDSGSYSITASNDGGEQTVNLELHVSSKPYVGLELKRLYPAGEIANITCNVVANPPPTVVWTFKECDVLVGLDCERADNKPISGDMIEENTFQVYTQSILKLHAKSSGYLTCTARNTFGSDENSLRLFVTDGPETFTVTAPDTIVEGDNVTIICATNSFDYTEELQVLGRKNESSSLEAITDTPHRQVRMSHGVKSTKVEVKMNPVDIADSGFIVCRARRRIDAEFEEKPVAIHVLESVPAAITKSNLNGSEVVMSTWEQVQWTCEVKGVPTPEISWYHEENLINSDSDGPFEFLDNKETLKLKSMTSQVEGSYKCCAENRLNRDCNYASLKLLERLPYSMIITFAVLAVFLLIVLLIVFLGYAREKRRRKALTQLGLSNFHSGDVKNINPALTLQEQADLLPYDSKWEFPKRKLKLGMQLGAGAFGVVYKGEATGIVHGEAKTTVAVKMAQRLCDANVLRALAGELKIMSHLGAHPNVVKLLGAVTTNLVQHELMVILEFCKYGNIKVYIRDHKTQFIDQLNPITDEVEFSRNLPLGYDRNRIHYASLTFPNSVESKQFSATSRNTESTLVSLPSPDGSDFQSKEIPLSTTVLINWSYQISRGMEWLVDHRILHGDLAARNILLSEGNIVKICDFGLARNVYENGVYRKVDVAKAKLPIKWLAIESCDFGIFSTQSDVWSYGIVLWELFSLSREPYSDNSSNVENLIANIRDGYRMEKPLFAPKKLYNIMLQCWDADPAKRPTFLSLSAQLCAMLQETDREYYMSLEEEFKRNAENSDQDYLLMMKSPDYFDNKAFDSNLNGANDRYFPMGTSKDGMEMQPMLPPSQDADYLPPRSSFIKAAVSNPSYAPVGQAPPVPSAVDPPDPPESPERPESPQSSNYGRIVRHPVRESIKFFENMRKKDKR